MASGKRLRLDEIVASFPELGPTVPDGGYAWIVLCGVFLVQMTVPSVLAMYGIVVGYIYETTSNEFYPDLNYFVWTNEKIIYTPILFVAFWNLADPWTKVVVNIASIPSLVGIVGVILLIVGIIASGYLATGGVGAYLASISAGAVMGVGASFLTLLSDHVLRKYFRKKLLMAITFRNIGTSVGLVLVPSVTCLLLHATSLKSGLQLMTIVLVPTALGVLTFRLPSHEQTSPYSLLLSTEEDTELPISISPDVQKDTQHSNNLEESTHNAGLFGEGSNIYAYEDPDEDVDLFVNPMVHSDNKWKHQFSVFKNFRFWPALVGWLGVKVSTLYFWLLLPIFSYEHVKDPKLWLSLSIIAGIATFLPNFATAKTWQLTNQSRRIYFGSACWLCSVSLMGLYYASNYWWLMIFAFLGGTSTGSLSTCQDLALYDVLGREMARSVHKVMSTIVGLCILVSCFIQDVNICLSLATLLQCLGGFYWILSPTFDLLKSAQYRSRSMNNRSRSETT